MALITLPHTFAEGDTTDATKFNQNINDPAGNSFAEINGGLQATNLAPGVLLTGQQFQFGAMHFSYRAGAKRTIAWTKDAFTSAKSTSSTPPAAELPSIPGLGMSFDVPFAPSMMLIMWSLYYSSNDDSGIARLWYTRKRPSDASFSKQTARGRRTLNTSNLAVSATTIRYWTSKRRLLNPGAGRYHFAVRIQRNADQAGDNKRIFTDWRSFKAIAFP